MMSGQTSAALVVDGEASESDNEVEAAFDPVSAAASKAFVVTGEAPESDEEGDRSVKNRGVEEEPPSVGYSRPGSPVDKRHHSLLHRKLWESNVRLRASAEGLLRHTSALALQRLSAADKMLLSAQESLRTSNANLSLAHARLKRVRLGLVKANCSSALPTVRMC